MAETVAITAGAGTVIGTDEVTINAVLQQLQRIKIYDGTDGGTAPLLVDSSNRAQVATSGATITSSSTAIAVATPANTAALDVSKAGTCTFIIKNTTAGSAWAGAPVMVFEQSDDSTSWATLPVVRSDTGMVASTFTLGVGAANAELMFDCGLEGVAWVRVRCTTAPATNGLTIVIQPTGGAFSPLVAVVQMPSLTGTASAVAASATVVTLLAANNNRLGYTVFNDSTATLYLLNAAAASLTAYTVQIAPSGYYEGPLLAGRGYQGIVTGLWSAATGNARVVEHA